MNLKQQLERMGATPGKLALIGLLSTVLVAVIVKQLPKGETESLHTSSTAIPQQLAQTAEADPKDVNSKPDHLREKTTWPVVKLSEALACDPFEPPTWAVQEQRIDTTESGQHGVLADLQKKGASIVVISAGRKSAKIGPQRIHVGDILEGYQVTDITTQGILLDKLGPR